MIILLISLYIAIAVIYGIAMLDYIDSQCSNSDSIFYNWEDESVMLVVAIVSVFIFVTWPIMPLLIIYDKYIHQKFE